jgi:multiple sugar transport system permease protein
MATSTSPSTTDAASAPPDGGRRGRRKRSDLERDQRRAGLLFVTPAMTGLLVFTLVPIFMALWVSFRDWTGFGPPTESAFVGFDNYRSLTTEPGVERTDFAISLRNNFYYVLGVVPLQTSIAFFLANLLNQRYLKAKGFFRTAYYFPSITGSIAISLIFIFLFQRNGAINWLLSRFLPIGNMNWLDNANGVIHNGLRALGMETPPEVLTDNTMMGVSYWQWLSGPSVTLLAIMLLATWTTIGTMMLIFLAGLQGISGDVEEASQIDGASRTQHFFFVTLPLMKPTLFFVLTIGIIGTWQVFDQIFAISAGGPQKTTLTPAYMVYREGFRNFAMGRAAAVSFLLFLIIMTFTLIQRRILKPEEQ